MPSIIISGQTFTYAEPFPEGHTLTREEAAALSSLKIEEVLRALKRRPTLSQIEFDDALRAHRFAPRVLKNSFDEVQTLALKLVTPLVENALRKKGIDCDALTKPQMEQFLLKGLEKRPDLLDEARRRIHALDEEVQR